MNQDELREQAERIAQFISRSLLKTRNIVRIVAVGLLLWYFSTALLWVASKMTPIILLVILSIFLAYLLDPLVDLVQKPFDLRGLQKWMPRSLAIAIVYLAIFGAIGLGLSILLPKLSDQAAQFAQQVPSYKVALQERANKIKDKYETSLPPAVRERINKNIAEGIEKIGSHAPEVVIEVLLKLVEYLPWLVLVPVLAFFLLKDASSFHNFAVQAFPSGVWRMRAEEFFQDVNRTLAAYIRAQLIACFLIGGICFIGFYFLGLNYAILLAVIAGVLEFIPLVGPLVVAIIAVSLASYDSGYTGLKVLVFLVVLRIVHDYVTYPRIIREGIHLHPIAIILAILGGTELAGIAGVFLAIPVVALATVAYRHWVKSRGGTGLVADILQEEQLSITSPTLVDTQGNLFAVNVTETKEVKVEVEKINDKEGKS
jgi:predicted PurR-regulated permease PerM